MWLLTDIAFAGLGPATTVVLYNADAPEAVAVAEAYAAARSLPAGHLCGITGLDPLLTDISVTELVDQVLTPFATCMAALPQPDEIDAVVTVRGLPYVVALGTPDDFVVGFEAVLQIGAGVGAYGPILGIPQLFSKTIGFHVATVRNPEHVGLGVACDLKDLTLSNTYQAAYRATCGLQAERDLPPAFVRNATHATGVFDFTGELSVVTRLDGFDYDDALALIGRGVAADGTFPTAPLLCMRGADEARSARDPECELATRRLTEAGIAAQWLDTYDSGLEGLEVAGYFTGANDLTGAIDGLTYVPGAIADNLAGLGAVPGNFFCNATGTLCPVDETRTAIGRFVRAGATGVHGTVAEPLNNSFPNAGAFILYASGYSLGESFLYNQEWLYWQNLVLGDPLTTPYAERPVVTLPPSLSTSEPFEVAAAHPDGVLELRLYIDGVRVADAAEDSLSWAVDRADGEVVDVLAVALADDAVLARGATWPEPAQIGHAEVQGWATATFTVGAPPPTTTDSDTGADGTGDTADDGGGDDKDGKGGGQTDGAGDCGCADTGRGGAGWWWLAALLVVRRRSR